MALHLVGETIDKTRSHYLSETGRLVQLMRGIYADAGDDVDAVVLGHAVRIARYLYPNAYLSAASAVLLGAVPDGRLFLSGRRVQRTRIRGLEIIQNKAPEAPSLGTALVKDAAGEFRVDVSSLRQRFLEAFRLRSEQAASIDGAMRQAIAERLAEEYGSPQATSDAVWALARANGWYREGEGAERFLLRRPAAQPTPHPAALTLFVAWHGSIMGTLRHDGFEWRWTPAPDNRLPLVRQTSPGKLPPFIVSLLPEGWLESVLHGADERAVLRSGRRYMSNITIAESAQELAALPADVLLTPLQRFTLGGVFAGTYAGPARRSIEESFERNLARLYERPDTPRLSGVQIKAPMVLGADGSLSPSTGTPFTHILKPAGTGGFEALPLVEWAALALARAAAFDVPASALVSMPDGMQPALLVERFDVRRGVDDQQRLAMEDLCSVLDLPPAAKYDGTMERVARAVRALSTAPDDDVLIVFRRALFAWLIADGDMHLKNMALLKIAEPADPIFRSVRFAPVYDAVTTRVFPRLETDRMALKLNGKDERLRRADFKALAATIGIRAAQADAAMDDTVERLHAAATDLALPAMPGRSPADASTVERMLDLCRTRAGAFN